MHVKCYTQMQTTAELPFKCTANLKRNFQNSKKENVHLCAFPSTNVIPMFGGSSLSFFTTEEVQGAT